MSKREKHETEKHENELKGNHKGVRKKILCFVSLATTARLSKSFLRKIETRRELAVMMNKEVLCSGFGVAIFHRRNINRGKSWEKQFRARK